MIKISIVIPVYNVANYIVRCLESITKQTYKGDIECILVDDCGPDNSAEICEEYVTNYYGRIEFKLIHRTQNGGLSAARNSGVEVTTGDYLFFLDSDDEIPANAIELLAAEVEKHPGIDVVMGFMYDDRHTDYYNLDCFRNHQYTTDVNWIQYHTFSYDKRIPVNGCNKLLRKQFFIQSNLYFKPGLIHEDDHWMFYLVKSVKSWAFVFDPTYIRYWNDNSIMTGTNPKKEAKNWIMIMLDHSKHFYKPFDTLQLSRYMHIYFCNKMFEVGDSNSGRLHLCFLVGCIRRLLWKEAIVLCLWVLFHKICMNERLENQIIYSSSNRFMIETNKWKQIYGE